MRAAECRKAQSNGTQNTLQGAQIKGCSPGLQIRPRRFDSGFGLHIRKPRRSRSTGFFYACNLMISSATFGISSATRFVSACIVSASPA